MARNTAPWIKPALVAAGAVVVLLILVIVARIFVGTEAGTNFLGTYSGASKLPDFATVGLPVWLNWQHFLNAFFLVFIVRSGWLIRTTTRPGAYWTRKNSGLLRTKGKPVKISINHWFHLSVDVLWVLNGLVFYVLLFSTAQWTRVIPTRWDIFPNAISAGIQYLSLHWPTESGWSNYNALQVLSYFVTIFIAAPLALLTGLRMTPGLAAKFKPLEKVFPLPVARKLHLPVMIYFVAFVIVHVVLVLSTGALRNLNNMYASNNDVSWVGFIFFAIAVVLMVAAWFGTRPLLFRPVAALTGKVTRS